MKREDILKEFDKLPKTKHAPDFKNNDCISVAVVKTFLNKALTQYSEGVIEELQGNYGQLYYLKEIEDKGFDEFIPINKKQIRANIKNI